MSFFEVGVSDSFRARHGLRLADGGFEQSHEHQWNVSAMFRAEKLDEATGVVIDFVVAAEALKAVVDELDGSDLNTLEAFSDGRTSAERVARHIARMLVGRLSAGELLYCLRVTEAPGCIAAYYP